MPTLQLFISTWEKSYKHIFSSTCFCYYSQRPNNNNKICPVLSSACFQHQFHHWFSVPWYNSDLAKLEWKPPLFHFNYIRDLSKRHNFFSIPVAEYTFFSTEARMLKTDILQFNIEISNYSKYYFKMICLLLLSSHGLMALAFESNNFDIMHWKIVQSHGHNEIKPPIGEVFWKYKTNHTLFCNVLKIIAMLICKQSLWQLQQLLCGFNA